MAVAGIAPGRSGNLTAEQEDKLRELWTAMDNLFGYADDIEERKRHALAETQQPTTGWFGRSRAAADDKYGQKKEYQEALARFPPDIIRASLWTMLKADNPDDILLRFLRARKWNVERALIMLLSTMNWRATDAHIDDDVMYNGEEGELKLSKSSDPKVAREAADFITQQRIGKCYMHGTDKMNRPICVVRVRLHKIGEHSARSLQRYTVFLIETARLTLRPPIDQICLLFDLTGFGMSNMDYTPLQFIIKVFEANYPESLGVVLVHNAPWLFQGAWRIIMGWLDPVVANKVQFTNNLADLEVHIARDRIHADMGGGEDWQYRYLEVAAGENARMTDTETRDRLQEERDAIVAEFEDVTRAWVDDPSRADLVARRAELADQLKANYWELDPYVRARSYFDRVGVLKEGGGVDFYAKI